MPISFLARGTTDCVCTQAGENMVFLWHTSTTQYDTVMSLRNTPPWTRVPIHQLRCQNSFYIIL